MGSLIPVSEDLNLQLGPSSSSSPTGGQNPATPFIIPKKEPKLEPLDEPLDEFRSPRFNSSSPYYLSHQNSFDSSSSIVLNPPPGINVPPSAPSPMSNSESLPSPSTDSSNVYSEFCRITEMFRNAFAQGRENGGDGAGADPESPDYSRALVVVNPENETQLVGAQNETSLVNSAPKRKYTQRSGELVRVTDLSNEDIQYFRDIVRKTRLLYDSIRVLSIAEGEKNRSLEVPYRRARGDIKASSLLRERDLWLNRDKRIVGPIPGIEIGDVFFFRMELCVIGLHGQPQAGIDYLPASQSSNGEPIATSVIVSGGYEDDEDTGEEIVYTGHGGQDKNNRQCMNQKLECGNLALERSMNYGIEVRVIRGFRYEGSVSGKVYVYDGLYRIVNCWFDVGKSGFGVFKYKLVRIPHQPEMGSSILKFAASLRTRPLEVRPKGYVSLDLSLKKERVPVFLFNDVDTNNEPVFYEYLASTMFPSYVHNNGLTGTGCDCVGGCFDRCFCSLKNGGDFAYDNNGILVKGKPVVFECGPYCKCPPSCKNRVSQKGVRNRFEVFRSRETGWGVRSLDLIQAGAFICEFTGVILTREQAQLLTMNGDSLVYPGRFSERWAEWGDLSDICPDYQRPTYPQIPPLDFAMDVSRLRNVACYISHSSSPNVFVQPVLYDHNNVSFPHLMLFAMENIPPLREISLDYGVADECTGKLAICN
ncbi:OLC1v1019510C1 [Oldenlandia corymbosa var. corymbosa]|uniref:OLC1v1019510C1 n=1 Tax=Oldenlandia corymbosa var. corymbosa TaxID=529605 RepID=A0AAV1EE41_OLDCO|nr:OLC1v1019510C1 [Oldenlandia corymbosa var. corymbosa]